MKVQNNVDNEPRKERTEVETEQRWKQGRGENGEWEIETGSQQVMSSGKDETVLNWKTRSLGPNVIWKKRSRADKGLRYMETVRLT